MADRKVDWANGIFFKTPGPWGDIRSKHIPRPGDPGVWDRVRKHQVEPHHTHYYSDEEGCWYEIDRSDPYWKEKENDGC